MAAARSLGEEKVSERPDVGDRGPPGGCVRSAGTWPAGPRGRRHRVGVGWEPRGGMARR